MLKHLAVSPAANRWQAGLIQAIRELGFSVVLLSHLPEPYWPKGECSPGSLEDLDPLFGNLFIRYWNIPLLRSFSLRRAYTGALREFCEQRGKPLAVLSYNPSPQNIATGLYAQKHYQIPWIDICADHHDPGLSWSRYPVGAKRALGHVFLSYHAFQDCPFRTKLHLDGGISRLQFDPETQSKKNLRDNKIVLYSGMMGVWGGVSLLLKAFERIHGPDVELWICGHGRNPDLDVALKRDSRIRFFGLVSESRLQEICKQASVLVNPRPSNLPGNTMNFPSKVLEYLSYGKPVISTWTLGLSPEYREVLEVLREETEDCLAHTIEDVLRWPDERRQELAKRIGNFLLKQRTWGLQAQRLKDWLDKEIL